MEGLEHWLKPEDGSEKRFAVDVARLPWVRHRAWWLLHNCVAHPLIGLCPAGWAFDFHDWTGRRMHQPGGRAYPFEEASKAWNAARRTP